MKKNKIISMLLCVLMLVSLSAVAFAEEESQILTLEIDSRILYLYHVGNLLRQRV